MTIEKKGSGSSKKLFDVPYKTTDIASIRIADTDLVVVLKNGQRIVVRDGAMRAMLDTDLLITFVDGQLRASDLLKQVGDVQLGRLSGATVGDAAVESQAPALNAEQTGSGSTATSPSSSVADAAPLLQESVDVKPPDQTMSERVVSLEERVAVMPEAAFIKPVLAANISPAWGALGLLGALGGAGGASAAAVASVTGLSSDNLLISGFITLSNIR